MQTPPGSLLLPCLAALSSLSPPCFARHMGCTPARSGNSLGGAPPCARPSPCPPCVTIVASRDPLRAFGI
eukprot:4269465-Prymnesium_polylepis.1